MSGPWEKYGQQAPARSGPPAFIAGTPDPNKAAAEARANNDQQLQQKAARRQELEWNASHNPDGTKKPEGEATGQAYSQSAMDAFDRALGSIKTLRKHPGFNAGVGMPSINPLDGNIAGYVVPGSRAAGFRARLNTLKAQVFLPMVQSMKGMGALSNAEGQKLTDAIGVLDPSAPEDEFLASLDQIEADLQSYKNRGAALPRQGAPQGAKPQRAAPTGNVIHYDAQGNRIK